MVANALYLLAWLVSCGSHRWASKISVILWICCFAAVLLPFGRINKTKAMNAAHKSFFGGWIIPNVLFYIFSWLVGVIY
jgi:hypothetical protein